MDIPVYLFSGFLDAGKTKLIKDKVDRNEIPTDRNTLLLLCENGEDEFDMDWCEMNNVYLYRVRQEAEMSYDLLSSQIRKYKAEQIICEYNGMWNLGTLYNTFPYDPDEISLFVVGKCTCIDALTFHTYYENLSQSIADKLRSSDQVFVRNMKEKNDVKSFYEMIRKYNGRSDIYYDYGDGRVVLDTTEYPAMYDLEASPIQVFDQAFAYMCFDMKKNPKRYDDKLIQLRGHFRGGEGLKENELPFGHNALKYSVHDARFVGLVCENARVVTRVNPDDCSVEKWFTIIARVSYKIHKYYDGQMGPLLEIVSIEDTQAMSQDMTAFI